MSLFWIIVIAVVGLALVTVAVVLLVRQRKSPPKPKPPPSLASVWRRFQKSLPESARRDPVIVVLGERLAGKSRLVQVGMELGNNPALAAWNGPDDARLALYSGRQARVQELSGELLEDARPETRDALRSLWEPVSLEIPVVVAVLDAHAPSWSPGGLRRLGSLVRDKVDLLTTLRGAPPRVRVAVTHLDVAAEGFVEIAAVARAAGHTAALTPIGRTAAELSASVAVLDPYLSPAVGELSPADLGRASRFLTATGPRFAGALAPFLDALLAARDGTAAAPLDGIVLGALPESGATVILGDPLAVDGATAERDARVLDRRRATRAITFAGIAAALLLGLYVWHYRAVGHAEDAVRQLTGAVERAEREPQKSWATNTGARAAEAQAGDALDAALAPLYPPLRLAYPATKRGLADTFLQKLRELYVVPVTQGPDRVKRIYALSLLYATSDDALGELVKATPEAWATALDVPARVVTDYLAFSQHRFTGAVPLPAASAGEVGIEDWQRWLDQLDAAFQRTKITPSELSDLQKKGRELSDAAGGALELRGLENVIRELRAVRGDEIDAFIGKGPARQRAPEWVSDNWGTIDALLSMVQKASLSVPAAQGKSLRKALDDIALAGRAEPETGTVYTLTFAGHPTYVFKADAWSTLMRASRAALYTQAFLDDIRTSGRSPLFARGTDYASVGFTAGRGVRGPTRSLPGLYTAQAVAADVKPALLAFDPTLDGAALPSDDRASLTRLVQSEVSRYAASYRAALWDYIASFRLDVTSVAGLRSDLEDMVSPASWFTDFWLAVADNARLDAEGNVYLGPLVQALAGLSPIVAMMTGDKGKYPALDPYYAVVTPLLASLDTGTPAPPGPPGAPLEDRLPPLGKFGLAILDPDKPALLSQVNAFLDGARLLDKSLRAPFLSPVELSYEYALQNVERTLDQAYRGDVRPLVAPLLSRFPIDPRAEADAGPDELLSALGPKGTFRAGIDGLLVPVCKKGGVVGCVPKAPVGYRAVRIPSEAIELAAWSASFAAAVWDDGGKPKPLAFQTRPRALPEVKQGDTVVATSSFLRSGSTTVYAFNQVPSWQPLPVVWSASTPAAVGVERMDPASREKLVLTTEGAGALWRFYRLLCKAERVAEGSATWSSLEPPVTFDLQPDPWTLVVPPGNKGRRCSLLVAGK